MEKIKNNWLLSGFLLSFCVVGNAHAALRTMTCNQPEPIGLKQIMPEGEIPNIDEVEIPKSGPTIIVRDYYNPENGYHFNIETSFGDDKTGIYTYYRKTLKLDPDGYIIGLEGLDAKQKKHWWIRKVKHSDTSNGESTWIITGTLYHGNFITESTTNVDGVYHCSAWK